MFPISLPLSQVFFIFLPLCVHGSEPWVHRSFFQLRLICYSTCSRSFYMNGYLNFNYRSSIWMFVFNIFCSNPSLYNHGFKCILYYFKHFVLIFLIFCIWEFQHLEFSRDWICYFWLLLNAWLISLIFQSLPLVKVSADNTLHTDKSRFLPVPSQAKPPENLSSCSIYSSKAVLSTSVEVDLLLQKGLFFKVYFPVL